VPAFSAAQIETLAQDRRHVQRAQHPVRQIPDSKVGRRGIGYHRLGVPGYMLPGTEQWSTAKGKVCPGNRRIAQIPQVIARAQQILNGDSDLDANQAQQLDYVYTVLKGGNPSMDVLSVLYHALLDPLNSAAHHGNDSDNPLGHAVSAHKYAKQAADALAKGVPSSGGVVSAGGALSLSDDDVSRIADALAVKLAGRLES
jgi:hypothetical protein